MTDFVEYIPKRHGQRPPYWTPDTLTGLDNKNYVRQPNWAWIAGTTYYVPYEAVHGVPRLAPVEEGVEPDLTETTQANTIEELRAANERWAIAFKLAEERANERIEELQGDKAKMRKTLEQIAYGGAGVPYGYFGEPLRAYQLQRLAIAALQETER